MNTKVHVITAVHNRYATTEKFIKNVLKQTYENVHVVLVDDGSTDGTSAMVRKYLPNTTIISGNGGLWWAGALHKAYKWICKNACDNEYIMISNDDIDFNSNYICLALLKLRGRNKVLVSGLGISKNTGQVVDSPIDWNYEKCAGMAVNDNNKEANCVSTRSLFMKVSTMKLIGGFHPILLPHYASDYEWTIRASRKGCKIESYSDLNYKFNEDTTGIRDRKKSSLKQIFSKKSNFNPIYRFNFIVLSTPIRYFPKAIKAQIQRII